MNKVFVSDREVSSEKELRLLAPYLGYDLSLGDNVRLQPSITTGRPVRIFSNVRIGHFAMLGNGVCIKDNVTIGNRAQIGNFVTIKDNVTIGEDVTVCDNTIIHSGVVLGGNVSLGPNTYLGKNVRLSDNIRLDSWVRLGEGVTSKQLNLDAIADYQRRAKSHVFLKWVTPSRLSPIASDNPLWYKQGEVIEVPTAEVSDKLCDVGIHVTELGYRPEWLGFDRPDHTLIPLRVEVMSNDICFAGVATMRGKLRVRKVRVLD
jgi:acetyltransferase-like isoleucine patch superfamily enzyme